jgi:hypothetical protein
MSTPNPFTAGCIDCHGKPIPNATPNFFDKDRIFDPTNMPRYANDLGLPSLLLRANPILKVIHLHLGPDFGGKHTHNGISCAEQDTVVMVVGAREIRGKTAGARWFGEGSKFNRQSIPNNDSIETQIMSATCAGKCDFLNPTFKQCCIFQKPTFRQYYILKEPHSNDQ